MRWDPSDPAGECADEEHFSARDMPIAIGDERAAGAHAKKRQKRTSATSQDALLLRPKKRIINAQHPGRVSSQQR